VVAVAATIDCTIVWNRYIYINFGYVIIFLSRAFQHVEMLVTYVDPKRVPSIGLEIACFARMHLGTTCISGQALVHSPHVTVQMVNLGGPVVADVALKGPQLQVNSSNVPVEAAQVIGAVVAALAI
jgi:hypothetical protein